MLTKSKRIFQNPIFWRFWRKKNVGGYFFLSPCMVVQTALNYWILEITSSSWFPEYVLSICVVLWKMKHNKNVWGWEFCFRIFYGQGSIRFSWCYFLFSTEVSKKMSLMITTFFLVRCSYFHNWSYIDILMDSLLSIIHVVSAGNDRLLDHLILIVILVSLYDLYDA